MKQLISSILIFIIITTSSCNMEKEVDLKLPTYESKMFVECYLEPGQPFQLSLYESVSYLDVPSLPTIENADVKIICNGVIYQLNDTIINNLITQNVYNYGSKDTVPLDFTNEFTLQIIDNKTGRFLTGKTRIFPKVAIDTFHITYNNIGNASISIHFNENINNKNQYRYYIKNNWIGSEVQDIVFTDDLFNSPNAAIQSNYKLNKGDNIKIMLLNISEDYYNFLQSINDAEQANGNPFAQPSSIKSNVTGGIGIFTGFTIDKRDLIID